MITFHFPAPADRLSLNDRIHHMKRYRLNKTWKDAVATHARSHANSARIRRPLGPSRVRVDFYVAANGRRDSDNAYAGIKPVLDGLVAAGWFPDDSIEHVLPSVSFIVDKANAGRVRITVTPWEEAGSPSAPQALSSTIEK